MSLDYNDDTDGEPQCPRCVEVEPRAPGRAVPRPTRCNEAAAMLDAVLDDDRWQPGGTWYDDVDRAPTNE